MHCSISLGKAVSAATFLTVSLSTLSTARAQDTVRYRDAPAAYPLVTSALQAEYGTVAFPPLTETTQTLYQVTGTGTVNLTFRLKSDAGSFLFDFGYYRITPALSSIDLSTDAGKVAYATQALAPGNATLVFTDVTDNPGATRTLAATGGDILGFFLIPDARLSQFQTTPSQFAVNGIGSVTISAPPPYRFPLFSVSNANPGGRDQMLSFSGISAVTGRETSLFAWEDLTRASITRNPLESDNSFNDLVFTVEGVQATAAPAAVPEPGTVAGGGILGATLLTGMMRGRLRRNKKALRTA